MKTFKEFMVTRGFSLGPSGVHKPMVTANQKIKNELSVKLKQKVLDRKIKRAKAKFLTKKFLSKP